MSGPVGGRGALVTGGARGIGRAISLALSEAGFQVCVADLSDGRETVSAIASRGGRAYYSRLDVRAEDEVKEAVKEADRELGGLYVLVNNAGVSDDQLLGRMKTGSWDQVMSVNLNGCMNMCRAAARVMLKRREGRIVNISSVVARTGRAGQANYAASKAGIEGLTRSLALELAHRGITVNAVAPGYIDTEMTRSLPDETQSEIISRVPLGRAGAPEDVAMTVVFLAGPGGSYLTGQTLHVNGGLYFG